MLIYFAALCKTFSKGHGSQTSFKGVLIACAYRCCRKAHYRNYPAPYSVRLVFKRRTPPISKLQKLQKNEPNYEPVADCRFAEQPKAWD
jgi:hypothetical protein